MRRGGERGGGRGGREERREKGGEEGERRGERGGGKGGRRGGGKGRGRGGGERRRERRRGGGRSNIVSYLNGFWSKSSTIFLHFLTLLKCCRESGLTWHISVTRHTPVSRTPWFFSFRSWRVVGTNTSIRSGTLRTIRTAHSAA